jgi:hypothetical protein
MMVVCLLDLQVTCLFSFKFLVLDKNKINFVNRDGHKGDIECLKL